MHDKLIKNGSFSVSVIDAHTGDVIENYTEKNLVVSLGKTNLCKLLGGDVAGKKISKIAIGTNGTDPQLTDNALTNVFSKDISGASYPTDNSVMFSWSLEANEGNGITILEFGLLNDDGILCARKVRTAIVKTNAVRLVGTWTITIN